MTDNEYAATEIMGWEAEDCRSLNGMYYTKDGFIINSVSQWLPDSNYSQLRLVEDKVYGGTKIEHGVSFIGNKLEKSETYASGTPELDEAILPLTQDEEIPARLELAVKCHRQSIRQSIEEKSDE
jgi:hypothetical protein